MGIAGEVSAATGVGLAVGYGAGIADAEAQLRLIREHAVPFLEKRVAEAEAALAELDEAEAHGAKAK